MNWTGWIAFRFLRSKKSTKFLSFITLLSLVGVAIGVTAMIVVLSVMDGFEGELKARLISTDLHILVTPTEETSTFQNGLVSENSFKTTMAYESLKEDPRVESIWPMIATEAIVKHGRRVVGAQIKGIDESRLNRLKKSVVEMAEERLMIEHDGPRSTRLPDLYVGQELAYQMGIIPGDRVTLVSPSQSDGPGASVPRVKRFAIAGVYHAGGPDQELHVLFAKDSAVRSFLRKAEVVSQWEITTKKFEDASFVAEDVKRLAPQFRTRDWIELNAQIFASLRLERIAMFLILAVIVIVASFNIVTTLTMMVIEKKREISILRAMGATSKDVGRIFLTEGIIIGGAGVLIGVVVAFIICVLLKNYEFIQLPDVYYDPHLPVNFVPAYYILVSVSAFLIVLGACLYPSRRASQVSPIEGIRLN
jgi:lipoprotein-releasing system permease protein